ncbi:Light-mediated development protein DET1 [Hibiscus syriacus]|uniref:Light-mediated development protein DET1 n=1 Tax=Hibiscus syriacus TaxID=106335 RepID=A0A6A2WN59_HIBSY|nr:Light-mediated development protein DET1 [Hibiscus syriacus]
MIQKKKNFDSKVTFKTNNVASRIFERQIRTPAPGTSIHCARRFYENLVPGFTIYDLECPDNSFFKFTDDGQYFVSFSRNRQDLIVYRPTWLSYSCKEEDCDNTHELPPQAKKFESFFTQLYVRSLASCNELICKDFFIYMESNQFGIFATSTAQIQDARASDGAILGVPSFEKITIHLLRLQDGVILDEKVFHNDCVNFTHNMGAFLYDDLLAVVSLRYQTIHILQIRDSGNLVDVRAIGAYCREDDELFINSSSQARCFCFYVLYLSFPLQRVQCLKKKFYFHFQDYVDLVILKVQFLDRHHLLIKFGSVDVGGSRNTDQVPAFFAVYNMETTEIVAFYQNAADELYLLFERFFDHFHATSTNSMYMNFISSHSNNIHALEQLMCMKNKATSASQFVKKMLSSLPLNCQSMSPSPYFDQSLFRFDEKLISATDRPRQSTDHPIRFTSRRQPNSHKFKIKTGPEFGSADGRSKRYSHFLFHPFLPLALSFIQPSLFLPPSAVNIHFRR